MYIYTALVVVAVALGANLEHAEQTQSPVHAKTAEGAILDVIRNADVANAEDREVLEQTAKGIGDAYKDRWGNGALDGGKLLDTVVRLTRDMSREASSAAAVEILQQFEAITPEMLFASVADECVLLHFRPNHVESVLPMIQYIGRLARPAIEHPGDNRREAQLVTEHLCGQSHDGALATWITSAGIKAVSVAQALHILSFESDASRAIITLAPPKFLHFISIAPFPHSTRLWIANAFGSDEKAEMFTERLKWPEALMSDGPVSAMLAAIALADEDHMPPFYKVFVGPYFDATHRTGLKALEFALNSNPLNLSPSQIGEARAALGMEHRPLPSQCMTFGAEQLLETGMARHFPVAYGDEYVRERILVPLARYVQRGCLTTMTSSLCPGVQGSPMNVAMCYFRNAFSERKPRRTPTTAIADDVLRSATARAALLAAVVRVGGYGGRPGHRTLIVESLGNIDVHTLQRGSDTHKAYVFLQLLNAALYHGLRDSGALSESLAGLSGLDAPLLEAVYRCAGTMIADAQAEGDDAYQTAVDAIAVELCAAVGQAEQKKLITGGTPTPPEDSARRIAIESPMPILSKSMEGTPKTGGSAPLNKEVQKTMTNAELAELNTARRKRQKPLNMRDSQPQGTVPGDTTTVVNGTGAPHGASREPVGTSVGFATWALLAAAAVLVASLSCTIYCVRRAQSLDSQ